MQCITFEASHCISMYIQLVCKNGKNQIASSAVVPPHGSENRFYTPAKKYTFNQVPMYCVCADKLCSHVKKIIDRFIY